MIENVDTKKRYIGSTVNLRKRLTVHERILRNGGTINNKVAEDLEAGHNRFFMLALEVFDEGTITQHQLQQKEIEYIEKYGTDKEYNCHKQFTPNRIKDNAIIYAYGNVPGCKGGMKCQTSDLSSGQATK